MAVSLNDAAPGTTPGGRGQLRGPGSKDGGGDGERRGRPRRRGGLVRVLLAAGLVVELGLYVAALVDLRPPSPGIQLSFNELVQAAQCAAPSPSGNCHGVDNHLAAASLLDVDHRVIGTVTSATGTHPVAFWTAYPRSDAVTTTLLQDLVASGANVRVDSQSFKAVVQFVTEFLLPLVILATLFVLLFSLVQGAGSKTGEFLRFGRLRGTAKGAKARAQTTFADVAAAGDAVVELAEVRDYLADPTIFEAMGALPPKGVLLVGPPGCGKTLLARAVAGEADATFHATSGSEFVEMLVGVGAARIRDLFARARADAPSIVFIDEIDAVGRQRGAGIGQGHDEREQTLNELLTQMDGFVPGEGVVVLAATNRPDILDPALMRAGRFDRHVTVERPDLEGRLEILVLHARGRRLADPEADLAGVARATPGFTGADLANLLNEAALLAVRERARAVTAQHLGEAVERVLRGPRRRARIMAPDEKLRVACHEAGHAVVAAAHGLADGIAKVSIVARGRGVGHLAVLAEDKAFLTLSEMRAQIAVAMAGLVAESMVFGEPSTGSEHDVERATAFARDMAGRYGMSDRVGPVRVLAEHREVFLGRDYLGTQDVSQPTLVDLDAEIRRTLDAQRDVAAAVLQRQRAVLDVVRAQLGVHETLQGPELWRLLDDVAVLAGNGTRPEPG